jgi:Enoyl-(Acyl carrier protein) reductase
VFTSSAASIVAGETRFGYQVSKAGLNAVTRFIAGKYGRQGIRANAVLPFVLEGKVGSGAAEFDRKKTLEGRGTTILTTSGSLLTLIFGLTVVVSGKDAKFENPWAVMFLMGALFAFVVSAVIAIYIAAWGSTYLLASDDMLAGLTTHQWWEMSEDEARRTWVARQVNTARSLRKSNHSKVEWIKRSLIAQVAAVALLSASVAIELWPCLCTVGD